jgi:hypothetical protein
MGGTKVSVQGRKKKLGDLQKGTTCEMLVTN